MRLEIPYKKIYIRTTKHGTKQISLFLAFHMSSAKHAGTNVTSPRCFRNCLLEIVELSWVGLFIQSLFPFIVPDD
jgi:hypothetical protein